MIAWIVAKLRAALDPQASASTRVARNVASILLGDAAADAINTLTTGRSALALGPGAFGALASAQAYIDPFRSLAGFGLSVVCVTVAARRGAPDGALVHTLLALHGALAVGSAIVALVTAKITGVGASVELLSAALLSALPAVALGAVRLPAQFQQAMHRLLALPLAVALARWALTEAAVRLRNVPEAHQWASAIPALLGLVATYAVVRRLYALAGRASLSLARELLVLAWPIAVLDLTVTVYLKAAYWFLRASGPGVVGAYAAADRLAQPVIGVSAAIVASALPLVSRAATSGDPHELAAIFCSSMRRAVTVLLPVVVAASALAPWAIRAIAPEYLHAVQPFRVLIVGTLFMFLNQLSSMFIVGIGRFRALMLVAFVNLAVYLALAARLVPTYGAVGSAIATTVMEAINCVMQLAVVAALLRARERPRSLGDSP